MSDNSAERYQQRYETWRHLDGLRYKTLQIVVTATGAVVAAIEILNASLPPLGWLAVSLLLFFNGKP